VQEQPQHYLSSSWRPSRPFVEFTYKGARAAVHGRAFGAGRLWWSGSAANLKHRPGPPTSQPSSKEPCKRVCSDPWIENPGVTHPRSRYPPASRRRARRSQACCRACWARAQRRGAPAATPRPRQQPLGRARTRAAGRGEGYRVELSAFGCPMTGRRPRMTAPTTARRRLPQPCGPPS
jgi:hypothetical protein